MNYKKIKAKQITYVIENEQGQLYSSITENHIFWTGLINQATLFDNIELAIISNLIANGTIKRMKYTLEDI